MKITQLTPGTGSFYCGSCLRDNTLGLALRRLGHDVAMVPLYLPFVLEEPSPDGDAPVLMGGINLYLRHRWPWLRSLPKFVRRALDAPGLLRFSAARSHMTDASKLGDLTLSMIRGEDGRQAAELAQLTAWLAEHDPPEVICLSNVLLAGMTRALKSRLGVPVICTLHGEESFLDALPSPQRETAWRALAERARDVDAFIAVSGYYGDVMQRRLELDPGRLHVVHNGIEIAESSASPESPESPASPAPPTIGYLARMCPDKGLHTLVEAFVLLKEHGEVDGLRLAVAGALLNEDKRYVEKLRERLAKRGLGCDVEFLPNVDRDRKEAFLRSLSVLSVPATYGESFGLYVLEALAVGVPVVQPRHGAFPELIDATGGGVLCEPDDPASLASALEDLLLDPARARVFGERGQRAVLSSFTADHMARGVENICKMVVSA